LDHCSYLAAERVRRVADRQRVADEKAVFEELRLAFGKKGVQAMIIEAAIPEIEYEANQLLSRMTEGRMHVRFETQRETLKGDTLETLDINIADELGTRSYELFSGGEAFRVNFAIRIALSKLLARRAGAQLQFLVIDEGFGTQDAEGRQRLVEAINSVQDDFERILAITHIEELRDAFPVRIEITKTADGSQFRLT
jgi:exonuclease SbcC